MQSNLFHDARQEDEGELDVDAFFLPGGILDDDDEDDDTRGTYAVDIQQPLAPQSSFPVPSNPWSDTDRIVERRKALESAFDSRGEESRFTQGNSNAISMPMSAPITSTLDESLVGLSNSFSGENFAPREPLVVPSGLGPIGPRTNLEKFGVSSLIEAERLDRTGTAMSHAPYAWKNQGHAVQLTGVADALPSEARKKTALNERSYVPPGSSSCPTSRSPETKIIDTDNSESTEILSSIDSLVVAVPEARGSYAPSSAVSKVQKASVEASGLQDFSEPNTDTTISDSKVQSETATEQVTKSDGSRANNKLTVNQYELACQESDEPSVPTHSSRFEASSTQRISGARRRENSLEIKRSNQFRQKKKGHSRERPSSLSSDAGYRAARDRVIRWWQANIMGQFSPVLRFVSEIYGILAPLLRQLFVSVGYVIDLVSKLLILSTLAICSILSYASKEVRQSDGAALSYLVFYVLPCVCDAIMANVSLPHVTPHIASNLAVFYACAASKDRHRERTSATKSQPSRVSSELSQLILNTVRMYLPVAFVVEGFSDPTASVMMCSVSTRLIMAYVFSMLRLGLVLSPFGWVGCSLQLLISTWIPEGVVSSYLLLFSWTCPSSTDVCDSNGKNSDL